MRGWLDAQIMKARRSRVDTTPETDAAEAWTPARILALRQSLGLSQEAFARRLGVSLGAVSRWEKGHRRPRGLSERALEDLERRTARV